MAKKRKIIVPSADLAAKRRAVAGFDDLLNSETREADWQAFFDEHPFVLTETLSLKVNALCTQVPLISGEPDYVFHRPLSRPGFGDYGVIELKRPDQALVGVYSTRHIYPSKHLRVAQLETERHLDAIGGGKFLNASDFFIAGNRRHAFIIMGTSAEIARKCNTEILQQQFRGLLPSGLHLYTYDELFDLFASDVPPQVHVAFASAGHPEGVTATARVVVTRREGMHFRPIMNVCDLASRFHSIVTIAKPRRGKAKKETADAKSPMELLMLAAPKGTELLVTASGIDANEAVDRLAILFADKFGMED